MIGGPQQFCKSSVIPPCHIGVQKLHAHWKYPLDLGFTQKWSATCRLPRIYSEVIRPPWRQWRCLPWRHHNVVWITIMTLLPFTKFWNLYCPRTIHFLWWWRSLLITLPMTLIVRDWENNGTICVSKCATRCRLLTTRHQDSSLNNGHQVTCIIASWPGKCATKPYAAINNHTQEMIAFHNCQMIWFIICTIEP